MISSRVYWTLNPMKLFRRELLERRRAAFPHRPWPIARDQLFVGAAYLHASGISWSPTTTVCTGCCAQDEGNITRRLKGSHLRLRFLPRMVG